jgi:subtilisin family serine protease/chitodextrinase
MQLAAERVVSPQTRPTGFAAASSVCRFGVKVARSEGSNPFVMRQSMILPRYSGLTLATSAVLLTLAGCGGERGSSSPSGDGAPDAPLTEASGPLEPGSNADGASDSPRDSSTVTGAKPRVEIANDRVAIKLAAVPAELRRVKVSDPAFVAWIQQILGSGVKVEGARLLRQRGSGHAADGSSLVVLIAPASEERIAEALERAGKDPGVVRAEADPIWTTNAVPNDPRYGEQWHLPKIDAAQAWDTQTGSSNVVVAVLDSGLDVDHADLAGAVWSNPGEVADGVDNDGNGFVDDVNGWNFVNETNNVNDTFGHGTHVAGIIGATGNNAVGVAGVAYGVKIMPVSVGGPSITASAVAEAIYYAVDEGADVINMSFGGPASFIGAREAIDHAVAEGVVLVASAGNGATQNYQYPAVYQEVIAVAALDPSDARTAISHYGRWVDVAAPGQAVVSTLPNDEYGPMSGTSQASPIVAGVAALVKSAHPGFTADEVRAQVLASAASVSATNPDYLGLLGAGLPNAALAVGPALVSPKAYVAGVDLRELTGNGDQEVSGAETAKVAVALHFTAGSGAVGVNLISNDPAVTVTAGTASLEASPDRSRIVEFEIAVDSFVASNHTASLSVEIENSSGSVVQTLPLGAEIAPAFRDLRLPFAFDRSLLDLPDGRQVLVADDSMTEGRRHRVYASFRNANGSFTPEVTFSDPGYNARRPRAIVAPNGDVHVIYYQYVASNDFYAFPAYTRYDALTGAWQPVELFTTAPSLRTSGDHNVAVALDSSGTLHLAWANLDGLVTTRRVNGAWTTPELFDIPDQDEIEVEFVNAPSGLKLLAHPVIAPLGNLPDFRLPTTLLEFNGTSWSQPVSIANVAPNEIGQAPYHFNGAIRRFFQAEGSDVASVATLSGTSWTSPAAVLTLGGGDFRRGFFGVERSPGSFLTFYARPVAATQGTEREFKLGGVSTILPGDRKQRARVPSLSIGSAFSIYAFTAEYDVERFSGNYFESPSFTSFVTNTELAASALPSIPVVVDAGDTTDQNDTLSASWSSSHSSGIAAYRVSAGTAPGSADLVSWREVAGTSATFDLEDQRLLPGQTVYVSVQARSSAVLSSDIGVSDGITYVPQAESNLCFASPWNSSIVYQDAGSLVTYQGATYRNLYWNSNVVPGTSQGPWELVGSCVGEPVLPDCSAPAWSSSVTYAAGTRVSHGGYEFVASWTNQTAPTGTSGNPWKWVLTCEP